MRAWLRQGCPCERDAEGKALLDALTVTRWRAERQLATLGPRTAARPPFPALCEGIRSADSFERLVELAKEIAVGLCRFTLSPAQAWALDTFWHEARVRLLRERGGGPGREEEAS